MKKVALIIFLLLFTLQGVLCTSALALNVDDQKKGEQKKKDPPGPARVREKEKKPEERPNKPNEEPKKGKKPDSLVYG